MSARPMTVLQVIPELDTGGAERTTLDIAAALVREGERAIVVSEGGRMVGELLDAGAEHITMPVATKRITGLRRNAALLADLMERENVDVVHAASRAPAWSSLWAASWTFRPLVTSYHGAYTERNFLKNRYNSVMARGDLVIANSAFTAALIARRHRFAADRIVTIHNGIDLSRFEELPRARAAALRAAWRIGADDPVILHLARLTPLKGQEVLLDALARLSSLLPSPWVAVFAGGDQGRSTYRLKLMEQAETLGIAERVRFVGHVDDVPAAFCASRVAVQPSTVPETFGLVAVEAQAAGLPVIVSDLGAFRETVLAPPDVPAAERSGWQVPARDPEALADALLESLMIGEEDRDEMVARGRAHAKTHFSLNAMTRKTLLAYHSVLEDDTAALYT